MTDEENLRKLLGEVPFPSPVTVSELWYQISMCQNEETRDGTVSKSLLRASKRVLKAAIRLRQELVPLCDAIVRQQKQNEGGKDKGGEDEDDNRVMR